MPLAGIISKPQKHELGTVMPELRAWLAQRGWSSVLDRESAAYLHDAPQHEQIDSVEREQMASRKPDLVIVLGGDGTLLAAARAFAHTVTPLLSVNLGALGFMTEVPLADLYTTLQAWCDGTAAVEVRSMIHAELFSGGKKCASGTR